MNRLIVSALCCVLVAGCTAISSTVPGIDGDAGVNGEAGTNGKDGDAGLNGETGAKGDPGPKGDTGAKGDPGLNGGADGKDGAPGAAGTPGVNGTNGTNGTNGVNGTNNKISKVWKCDFKRDPVLLGVARPSCPYAVDVWYYGAETTSGDMFVRAGIDTYTTLTRAGGASASSSEFWAAGTWEANNGANWLLGGAHELSCSDGYVGNWAFVLNKVGNSITLTYTVGAMQPTATLVSNCTN
jgi:hypothetical protein